ncbi:MAG TPA: GNAT family N-acetyltransferase [Actinomycetota bacterium]
MAPDLNEAIVTERLLLTPLVAVDADEMVLVLADPALGRFTGDEPPTLDALRARYAMLEGRRDPRGDDLWLNWVVRLGGAAIGYVQATVRGAEAWLAWLTATSLQGRGYASEASAAVGAWLRDELGISDLRAAIHDGHEASKGVARKIGLHPTDGFIDGERVWRSG